MLPYFRFASRADAADDDLGRAVQAGGGRWRQGGDAGDGTPVGSPMSLLGCRNVPAGRLCGVPAQIAMLVYPGPGRGVDAKGRVYGETGEGDASEAQRRAGSEYWRIAEAMRPKIRLLIVVQGEVRRIGPVMPVDLVGGRRKGCAAPGRAPADPRGGPYPLPGARHAVGGERPMRQGLMREYAPVDGTQGEDHRRKKRRKNNEYR